MERRAGVRRGRTAMKIIRRGILRSAYKKSDITDWISDAGVNVSKTHIGLSKHLRSGVEHLAVHKLSPAGTAFAAAAGIVNDNAVFFQRLQDGVRCTCPEASSVGQCNGVQNIGAYILRPSCKLGQIFRDDFLADGSARNAETFQCAAYKAVHYRRTL